jgi:hypothetical protein
MLLASGPDCGYPLPGYFLAQSLVVKRLRSGLWYCVGIYPSLNISLIVGLNAKARWVAGLNPYSIRLSVSGRVKLLAVEIVASDWCVGVTEVD